MKLLKKCGVQGLIIVLSLNYGLVKNYLYDFEFYLQIW